MADWRFVVCDLLGVMLRDLTPIARQRIISRRLNLPTSISFAVPSDDARVATLHTDGYPMVDEGRRTLKAYRDGVLMFVGPLWTVQDVGEAEGVTTAVSCFDQMVRLRKRQALMDEPNGYALSKKGNVRFTDQEGGRIVQHLIAMTNAYKGHCGVDAGKALYRSTITAHGGDLEFYYRLDPGAITAYDQSGNGLNGVKEGGPNAIIGNGLITGDGNQSVKFDGANVWMRIDNPGAPGGDVFSFEAWIRPTAFPPGGTPAHLIDLGTAGGAAGARVRFHSTGAIDLQDALSSTVICTSTANLSLDTIYHVVVGKSGATVKIRINGVDRTGAVTNVTLGNPSGDTGIGAFNTGVTNWYEGWMDELAWYSVLLSDAQIDAHYAAGLATPTLGATFEATPVRNGDLDYSHRDILSAQYELCTAFNGFDVKLTPLDRTDGIHGRLDIYDGLGSDKPNAVFAWGAAKGNVMRFEKLDSMEQVANDIEATGLAGILSAAEDSGSITAYGRYEDIDSFPDITNQALLDVLTDEELAFRIASKEMVSFTPARYAPRPIDDFDCGDTIRVHIGPRARGGASGVQRCFGYDIALDDNGDGEITNAIYSQQA